MSVEVLDGSFQGRLELLLGIRRQTVWLAAPFLTNPIAKWLVRLPAAKHGDRRLLVSWASNSIDTEYLSAHGVDLLRTSGFVVRNLLGLHAKMILAGAHVYIGSGNLTSSGVHGRGNTEIGVFADGSTAATAKTLFDTWWIQASPLSEKEIADAMKRQEQSAKKRGRDIDYEAQPGYEPPQPTPAPRVWIKSLHYRDGGWTIAPGEESWISDPGKRNAEGKRILRKDGEPAGKPGYQVGDEICLYFGTVMKVPLIVEVTRPPKFAPDSVQQKSYGKEPDAGERWPWLTRVKGRHRVPLEKAPDIDYLGIRGPITRGLPHFRLSPESYQKLLKGFGE
ncbi:MAG TPA: phospholipase D-like domain-containing protein [Solirubrobacteraceae bacterium]|jgi:hypothetical protein|nr:phospholipase D-like domain-containing protein [Solirubrobacteraceae bacterium]